MNPIALAFFLLPLFRTALLAQKLAPAAQASQAQAAQGLAAERRELAEIRLLVAAERGYAPAKERLAALATKLGASTEPEAKTLLADVTRFQTEVRRALGEAVDATAGQDTLDEAVYSALRTGDLPFVHSLGKRAVPALKSWIRAAPDQFTATAEQDPLLTLLQIDPLAADELAGERPEAAGFYWKKRVTRLYDRIRGNEGLRAQERWLGVGFTRSAEAWAEDPDVGAAALWFLFENLAYGERAPTFDALVARAFRSSDPSRRQLAMRMDGRQVGAPVYLALLGEADEDLRRHAADELARHFEEDPALLAYFADPDPRVRTSVAYRLSEHASGSAEELTALAALLVDPDEHARKWARKGLQSLPRELRTVVIESSRGFSEKEFRREVCKTPLAPEAYRAVVAKGFAGGLVEHFVHLPAPLCFEILAQAAQVGDPQLLEEVAKQLNELPSWEDPRATLEVATRLLANAALGDLAREYLYSGIGDVQRSRAELAELVRWLLARPDDTVLAGMLRRSPFSSERLTGLDPALAIPFLARMYPLSKAAPREYFGQGQRSTPSWTTAQAQASRTLAQDDSAPLGARVLGLIGLVNDDVVDDDFVALARPIVTDPAWRAGLSEEESDLLRLLQKDLGPATNALVLTVLRTEGLPERLPVRVVQEMEAGADGAAEVVALVVQRAADAPAWHDAVRTVLSAMGREPALRDPEVLARYARDPRLARVALGAIGLARDPRDLPLLGEIVARPDDSVQLAGAVEALCSYLDPEAVEPLLVAAAKVQQSELRDQCLAQLEKIREYQDAKERWATRKVKGATRAQVIAELVEQLGAKSDEVKVQAIRALATWEAVEVMPRLIELSVSGSKSVAAAAKDALERLNQPKGE
jgi:HEAT repeat protein